jgi:hypothetical protein
MSRRRIWCAATVLAAVVAVAASPVAGAGAAQRSGRSVPKQLVGTWTRNFTAAGWNKVGAPEFSEFVGPYTLGITANGHAEAVGFAAQVSQLSGGRLKIGGVTDCGSDTYGLYKWKVAKRRLTLTKVRDSCPAEVGLFAGVWKKK